VEDKLSLLLSVDSLNYLNRKQVGIYNYTIIMHFTFFSMVLVFVHHNSIISSCHHKLFFSMLLRHVHHNCIISLFYYKCNICDDFQCSNNTLLYMNIVRCSAVRSKLIWQKCVPTFAQQHSRCEY
jgi:hypothetical protein